MFKKILIANRGEIARRIMATTRKMAIKNVAVYSDADIDALHVREADEAVHIGPSVAFDSYLNINNIIDAAKSCGAEAIHPGYGFLSENPNFVEAVEAAGIVFIGPSIEAIRAMGLKDGAKKLMKNSGVPVVPGYHGKNQDAQFLADQAEKIGYPVLIKARAGGGGKGMRKVEAEQDFDAALEGAIREGEASFGDGHVLIEKFISSPRHIEIQIFGDKFGNVVHMFERDCSLQRRHQKIIEEAPAPGMSVKVRALMGEAAKKAAKAVNYCGAGTVEFIVDGSNGLDGDRFWFMEMNTRLQVEHPVSEMITGLDLVELQLRVANGEELAISQEDLSIKGWAFETRIYAEDPANGFLPSVGDLTCFDMPFEIARVDIGFCVGGAISSHYDPMIGKIITHGKDRPSALAKMRRALDQTHVGGVETNVAFLSALCNNKNFSQGEFDTGLIDRELEELIAAGEASHLDIAIGALVIFLQQIASGQNDIFDTYNNWRIWGEGKSYVDFSHKERQYSCAVSYPAYDIGTTNGSANRSDCYIVEFDENSFSLCIENIQMVGNKGRNKISSGDEEREIKWVKNELNVTIFTDANAHLFRVNEPLDGGDEKSSDSGLIIAPMPGIVKSVKAKSGDDVEEGQVLVILEAMKMEHGLVAPRKGKIEAMHVKEGAQVDDAQILATLVELQGE